MIMESTLAHARPRVGPARATLPVLPSRDYESECRMLTELEMAK